MNFRTIRGALAAALGSIIAPRRRSMLEAGAHAPDFTAITTGGKEISLHDFRGRKVILYFYPQDDTSGCTREACDFRDARPRFDEANAVILGVSMDDDASHQAFTEKYSLNFPLIVDTDGAICDAFGVSRNGTWAKRVTFLIDENGIIEKTWDQVSVVGHADEVLAAASGS
jgi:peroxiredoxin Q/BCP